jgi:uncharacterized protein
MNLKPSERSFLEAKNKENNLTISPDAQIFNNQTSLDNTIILQKSRFTHLFYKDAVYCLFHTLNMKMVFGGAILSDIYTLYSKPTKVSSIISQLTQYDPDAIQEIIIDLMRKGLLIKNSQSDISLYKKLFDTSIEQYKIQHMYILPTDACNFQCKYCFIENEHRPHESSFMEITTAANAISLFMQLSKAAKNPSITFYGGEPLLNPKTTFFALKYIRKLEQEKNNNNNKIRVSLLTNGSLVDNEAIRVFQETKPNISVSIDGPQKMHDSARVDLNGTGTFVAAIKGFRALQDAGLSPGVSCTLNSFTINHIDEIVDFVILDLKPRGMGFNLPLPQNEKNNSDFDYNFAVEQLIKAFKRLREAGIYEDRMMRRVRPFLSQKMHFKDCMGVGGQIVVTPSGRVGPCQAFLGIEDNIYFPHDVNQLISIKDNITSLMIYKNSLFNEWCQRFPLNMDKCSECFAISVCGGGCPYASAITEGSIWEIDKRVCAQAKNILEWMIWDTYHNMKNPN